MCNYSTTYYISQSSGSISRLSFHGHGILTSYLKSYDFTSAGDVPAALSITKLHCTHSSQRARSALEFLCLSLSVSLQLIKALSDWRFQPGSSRHYELPVALWAASATGYRTSGDLIWPEEPGSTWIICPFVRIHLRPFRFLYAPGFCIGTSWENVGLFWIFMFL